MKVSLRDYVVVPTRPNISQEYAYRVVSLAVVHHGRTYNRDVV